MPLSPRAGLASLGRALHPGSSNTSSGKPEAPGLPPPNGKTDLLLRFFDSQFFDEWIAITYLYKSTSPGVQDYLCNRLYSLPEAGIERYLSQLCQLVIHKPHSPLEKVLADLCARSLRIAVKVYWLLNAIAQDHPKLKGAAELRDSCEQAALEGYWDPPFRDPKLLPMSPPPGARWLVSPPLSPSLRSPRGRGPASPDGRALSPAYMDRLGREAGIAEASGAFCGLSSARFRSPEHRTASPQGVRSIMMSSYTMGQDGLICASPPAATNSREAARRYRRESNSNPNSPTSAAARFRKMRMQLSQGAQQPGRMGGPVDIQVAAEAAAAALAELEVMSPPSSPRLRQTTFGATLDFIEALCDASSGLTSFAPEDRQWALRRGLEEINREIEQANRMGVACWFPMGLRDERIVRLAAREASLLNSREKAPFVLIVEVLAAAGQEGSPQPATAEATDDEACSTQARRRASGDLYADSAHSFASRRVSTHAQAGPGPSTLLHQAAAGAAAAAAAGTSRTPMHRRNDTASSRLPSPGRLGAPPPQSAEPQFPHPSLVVAAADGSTSGQPSAVGESSSARSSPGGSSGTAGSIAWPAPARPAAEPNADPPGRPLLTTRRSLTFDDAAASQPDSQPLRQASGALPPSGAQQPGRQPSGGLARVSSGALHVPGRAVSSSAVMATRRLSEERQQRADSFSRGLQSAAKGLRGDGPLVSIRLEVLRDHLASSSASETAGSRADTAGESAALQSPAVQGSQALAPGGAQPAAAPSTAGEGSGVHQQPVSPTARGDGGGAQPRGFASSLLSRWGFFKRGSEEVEAAVAQAPASDKAAAARLRFQQPYVRVHFKVHGGINLRLDSRSSPKHRRVPSSEALRRMAQQQNSAIANPAIFSPIPEDFLKAPQQAPPLLPLSPALPEQLADVSRQLREGSLRAGRASIVSASARSLGSTASAKKHQVAPEDAGSRSSSSSSSSNISAHEREPEGAPAAVAPPWLTSQELYPVESAAAVVAAEAAAAAAEALRVVEEAAAEAEQQRLQAERNLQEASAAQRHWGSAWTHQVEPSQHPAQAPVQDASRQQGAEQQAPPAAAQEPGAAPEGSQGQGEHSDCAAALPEQSAAEKARAAARAIYGERWHHKCSRIQRSSPHGRRPGWAVRPVIVKSGDDCRQELLAVQLIKAFHDVFQEAELPLWLRPFDVLVTSNKTALIELIPDALSIHTIKAKSPPGTTLVDHFMAMHGQGTPECVEAQRNFAESMAAYSLVCYLLQIKDRHNGNLMLDTQGHIIHIDFGFMLSNSPGGVNFEAAPFKLTRELLEVLDSTSEGKASELFDYFKVLCIQGFLACRKHADRIILLVDMMSTSGCPAFKAGPRAIQALRKRFHLNLTEAQCVEVMLSLISDSLDAWRTRQYDYYQRVLNGIL